MPLQCSGFTSSPAFCNKPLIASACLLIPWTEVSKAFFSSGSWALPANSLTAFAIWSLADQRSLISSAYTSFKLSGADIVVLSLL